MKGVHSEPVELRSVSVHSVALGVKRRVSAFHVDRRDESIYVSPSKQTTSTSATTTTADSGPKKSVDELRNVLTKRWDQLARHRLVVLYAILFVYLLSFLISYVSRFQVSLKYLCPVR